MRQLMKSAFFSACIAGLAGLMAAPASAKCTRLAFSVNDYGKDGPTRDAMALLDKYVAKWALEHKIAKYQTGKKDVKCELFLNFIVFDEHTCRAEATVCFNEPAGGAGVQDAAFTGTPKEPSKAKAAVKTIQSVGKPVPAAIAATATPPPATSPVKAAAPAAVTVAAPAESAALAVEKPAVAAAPAQAIVAAPAPVAVVATPAADAAPAAAVAPAAAAVGDAVPAKP